MVPFLPRYVTERFGPPPYINCNFAGGLMLANKATNNKKGTSSKTVLALRKASDALHAATGPYDLVKAYKKLWGWNVAPFQGSFATLVARLRKDYAGAVVYLYPHLLPEHYRRWDPTFNDGHACYIQANSKSGSAITSKLWYVDPMIKETGYRGEWIDIKVLQKALQPGVPPVVLTQGSHA